MFGVKILQQQLATQNAKADPMDPLGRHIKSFIPGANATQMVQEEGAHVEAGSPLPPFRRWRLKYYDLFFPVLLANYWFKLVPWNYY